MYVGVGTRHSRGYSGEWLAITLDTALEGIAGLVSEASLSLGDALRIVLACVYAQTHGVRVVMRDVFDPSADSEPAQFDCMFPAWLVCSVLAYFSPLMHLGCVLGDDDTRTFPVRDMPGWCSLAAAEGGMVAEDANTAMDVACTPMDVDCPAGEAGTGAGADRLTAARALSEAAADVFVAVGYVVARKCDDARYMPVLLVDGDEMAPL